MAWIRVSDLCCFFQRQPSVHHFVIDRCLYQKHFPLVEVMLMAVSALCLCTVRCGCIAGFVHAVQTTMYFLDI